MPAGLQTALTIWHHIGNDNKQITFNCASTLLLLHHPSSPPNSLLTSAPSAPQRTVLAMTRVGIPPLDQEAIFRTVAAVLHLGNVSFKTAANEEAVPADAKAQTHLAHCGELFEMWCLFYVVTYFFEGSRILIVVFLSEPVAL